MPKHVVLAVPAGSASPAPAFLDGLAKLLPDGFELRVPPSWDRKAVQASAEDAEAMIGVRVPRELIMSAPKLRFIQSMGTGVDKIDLEAARERGITVCSAVGENATRVAEHCLALMLALAKNLHVYQREMPRGEWRKRPSLELRGRTLGIVGFGSVGVELARLALPLGMKVIAIRRHSDEEQREKLGLAFLGGRGDLDRVLQESDILVIAAVLTGETRGMMGEPEISKMKEDALLINVARGEIVDEEALERALRSGRLAGAGLDTFRVEPVDPDNPLLKLGNVILTPHVGGGGWHEASSERMRFLVENIRKALSGERPDNVVDTRLGYARKTTA